MRPRWYIPEGIPRPEHLPSGGIGLYTGPDGGVGICVGGTYTPEEPGWTRTEEGWWFNFLGCDPGDFLRLSPMDGPAITGVSPEHTWLIPRLLRPSNGGLVCAVPAVIGPRGYVPPPHLEGLMEDLRAKLVRRGWPDGELLALASRILAQNYHLCLTELLHLHWMSDQMVIAVILNAASVAEGEA